MVKLNTLRPRQNGLTPFLKRHFQTNVLVRNLLYVYSDFIQFVAKCAEIRIRIYNNNNDNDDNDAGDNCNNQIDNNNDNNNNTNDDDDWWLFRDDENLGNYKLFQELCKQFMLCLVLLWFGTWWRHQMETFSASLALC